LRAAGAQRLRRAFFLLFQIHTTVEFLLRKRFARPIFFSKICVKKGIRGIHDLVVFVFWAKCYHWNTWNDSGH